MSNEKFIKCCPTTTNSNHNSRTKYTNKTKTLWFTKLNQMDKQIFDFSMKFTRYRPSATCCTSYFFEHVQSEACRLTSLLIRSISVTSGRISYWNIWMKNIRKTYLQITFCASWKAFCNSLVLSVVRVRIFCQRVWTAIKEFRI
jgi:hypothetical protein